MGQIVKCAFEKITQEKGIWKAGGQGRDYYFKVIVNTHPLVRCHLSKGLKEKREWDMRPSAEKYCFSIDAKNQNFPWASQKKDKTRDSLCKSSAASFPSRIGAGCRIYSRAPNARDGWHSRTMLYEHAMAMLRIRLRDVGAQTEGQQDPCMYSVLSWGHLLTA